MDIPLLAGSFSTGLFVASCVPMLVKAIRTRDLSSYSRGQLCLSNVGNAANSVYVVSLPVGPIWFLHLFNVTCTLLMLVWHVRFVPGRAPNHQGRPASSFDVSPAVSRPRDDARDGLRPALRGVLPRR